MRAVADRVVLSNRQNLIAAKRDARAAQIARARTLDDIGGKVPSMTLQDRG